MTNGLICIPLDNWHMRYQSDLVLLKNTTHLPDAEKPELDNKMIIDFLNK